MSNRKKRSNKTKKVPDPNRLTYADALEATGKALEKSATVLDPILSGLEIGSHTQYKLQTVITMMDGIGKFPGDLPKEKFDQIITYHKLPPEAVDWLVKAGIPARRMTPFATL